MSGVDSHVSFQQMVFFFFSFFLACFGPGIGSALFGKVVGEKLGSTVVSALMEVVGRQTTE